MNVLSLTSEASAWLKAWGLGHLLIQGSIETDLEKIRQEYSGETNGLAALKPAVTAAELIAFREDPSRLNGGVSLREELVSIKPSANLLEFKATSFKQALDEALRLAVLIKEADSGMQFVFKKEQQLRLLSENRPVIAHLPRVIVIAERISLESSRGWIADILELAGANAESLPLSSVPPSEAMNLLVAQKPDWIFLSLEQPAVDEALTGWRESVRNGSQAALLETNIVACNPKAFFSTPGPQLYDSVTMVDAYLWDRRELTTKLEKAGLTRSIARITR